MEDFTCTANFQLFNDYEFVRRAIKSCNHWKQMKAARQLVDLFYIKHKSDYYLLRLNDFLSQKADYFTWF